MKHDVLFLRLRRRLTILFSLLTAVVLAAALALTCRMAQNEYLAGADLLFGNLVYAVEDAVTGNSMIRDSWLAEQETTGRVVVYIEDNGCPLAFPGGWMPADDRQLLALLAKSQATAAGLDPGRPRHQRVSFDLTGGLTGEYTCTALVLPHRQTAGAAAVYIIRDVHTLHTRLWTMIWQYMGLWLAGAVVLTLLCRWMVRRALRPTAQAMQRQREFVAAAGHELRSPLTVLKASLQAACDPATAAQGPAFLHSAVCEVDRLSRLTDDLLILAGGDAGVLRTALAEVETETFLIELYGRFAPVARAQGHTLSLDLPDAPLPSLHADVQRLEQLFAVLLNNAFEYAPADTPVELRAERPKAGGLRVAVTDHGPGVPDSEKQHVFERFTRGDRSRTGKAHFGLGLAVATEIATLHGAILRVQDTPGGGATFVVEWPAKAIC